MQTANSTMAMDMRHIMHLVLLITLNLDTNQATSRSTINPIIISQATIAMEEALHLLFTLMMMLP